LFAVTQPIVVHTTSEGWTTGAQIAAAAFTAVAAGVTAWMARETRKVASATRDSADETKSLATSTRDLAEETARMATAAVQETAAVVEQSSSVKLQADATLRTVEEMVRDRDLQWRPILSALQTGSESGALGVLTIYVTLQNAGGGPAIGTRFLYRQEGAWCITTPVDIPAGGRSDNLIAVAQSGPPSVDFFAPPAVEGSVSRQTNAVLFCSDILGRRYRFPIAVGPGGHVHVYPAEHWMPGDGLAPYWATPALIWPL
jgi:hypothetical protein